MKKIKKLFLAAGIMLLAAGLFTGCGKSKKSRTEDKVIHISAAPEPTVTPDPKETDPDAVTTNGNLTMVNEYLVDNPGAAPGSATATPEAADDGASNASQDTGSDSSDSGNASDGTDSGEDSSYDEGETSDEGDSADDGSEDYSPEDQEDSQDEG